MTDYIDKAETLGVISTLYNSDPVNNKILDKAHEAIVGIRAADVREVRKGRWVKAHGSWFTPGGDPVWECSECGKGRHVYGVEHGTYGADVADGQWVSCPNCGADMREE